MMDWVADLIGPPPGNADPRCEVGKLDPLSDGDGELEEGASSARTALAVTAMVAAMMRMRRILLRSSVIALVKLHGPLTGILLSAIASAGAVPSKVSG
jgi:hypothetical protein